MFDAQLVYFLLFAAVIIVTPGPDMALITQTVLIYGKRCAYWNILGTSLAACIHASLAVLGVSKVFQIYPWSRLGLSLFGAGYLAWIGGLGLSKLLKNPFTQLNSSPVSENLLENEQTALTQAIPSPWFHIRRGFLSTLLNVKVIFFFLTVLPGFIRKTDSYVKRGLFLSGINILMGLCWLFLFTAFLGILRSKLLRPKVRQGLGLATSFVMIGLSLKLIIDVILEIKKLIFS